MLPCDDSVGKGRDTINKRISRASSEVFLLSGENKKFRCGMGTHIPQRLRRLPRNGIERNE